MTLKIVSPGGLPAAMTEADLGSKSILRNPLLYGMLHRMEVVEHIGFGIKRIHRLCAEHGVAEPVIEVSEHWFTVRFPRPVQAEEPADQGLGTGTREPRDHVGIILGLSRHQVAILGKCTEDQDITALMNLAGRTNRTKFRNQVLAPLLETGLIETTIPDKPRSSKQHYRLTHKGRRYLEQHDKET